MAKKRSGHTPLHKHKKIKSRLVPPLSEIAATGKLQFSSWVDDRLPELLWLAVIRSQLSQDDALAVFRRIINRFEYKDHTKKIPIPTHSFLSELSADEFDHFLEPVLSKEGLKAKLGSLLRLTQLPDKAHWERHFQPAENAIHILGEAVFHCIDHQSQESTDIRWFSLMCMMRNGKMHLPDEPRFREMERQWTEYPNYGDQKSVRPSIRATEMAFRNNPEAQISPWCAQFWSECWKNTECIPRERAIAEKKHILVDPTPFIERLSEIYSSLLEHARESRPNTNLDAKHDASFGLVLYSLYLAYESLLTSAFERAIGQVIVRVIAEAVITHAFLRFRNDTGLWVKYRNFGTGQIKLSFLKLLEQKDVPQFIDMEFFERLIGEDFWHEHLEIDLGHWAGSDLRRISTEIGSKEIYDKYYSTTSPFVHASWSAVRMVSFETCFNPLHRFHRVPALPNSFFFPSFVDLKKLLNIALDNLAALYPEFKLRFRDEDLPVAKH